jgi:hypothetical protein
MRKLIRPDQPVCDYPEVIIGTEIYFPLGQPETSQRTQPTALFQLYFQKIVGI